MAKPLKVLQNLKDASGLSWERIAREAGLGLSTLLRKDFLLSPESGIALARALAEVLGERLDEVLPPLEEEQEREARILYALFEEQARMRAEAQKGGVRG